MSPDVRMVKQAGFGLPAAIFIVTVLALIIATMANIQRNSADGVSLQVQSSRAFYAAESGIEVALNLLLPPDGSAGVACALVTDPSANEIYRRDFTANGIAGCSVNVTCRRFEINSEDYFTLISTGRCGSGIDAAQRKIEVRAK